MVHIYHQESSARDTFSFTFSVGPPLKFTFDRPIPVLVPANRPFKRPRALSDVDGDGDKGRKKRRLRLHLVTSRLSRPFSQPASNIVTRGSSKIAIWGRNKTPVMLLRKAAIMNRVRLKLDEAKDFLRQQQQRSRETLAFREILVQKPRHHDVPLPPSPLGLSNYDALDFEDETEDDVLEGTEQTSTIYSDFNFMDPCTDEVDNDYLDALDGIPPCGVPESPPLPSEESIVEILREKESQGDSYSVHLGG